MKTRNSFVSFIALMAMVLCTAQAAQAYDEHKQDSGSRPASQGVVNVNTATAAQLSLLPGIGLSRAEAIIHARQRRPFRNVNELVRVRGIGRATLQRLRPYVTVDGETTLRRAIPMPRGDS